MTDPSSSSHGAPVFGEHAFASSRVAALRRYEILDTKPEAAFDRLTDVAAELFGTEIAFVAFLDTDRQWFKSSIGLDQKETDLASSFCTYTIEHGELFVIEDATEDERVSGSSFVTEMGLRFYAGMPIRTPEGQSIGTFSIMDHEPRSLSDEEAHRLQSLADMAAEELERRREARKHEQVARRFEAVLEDPNMLAGVLSPDGTLLEVNETCLQYVAEPRDAVLGRPFWETPWWPEHMRAEVRHGVERAATGEYVEYEASLTDAEGEPYSVEGTIRPVLEEGTVTALVVSASDVTERKQREEALRQTNAQLETLFAESPDMINVHDPDGNILIPNARLLDETGYSEEELTGMKVWELDRAVSPEEARELWSSMEVGDKHRFEGTYQRRDGSTFPVEVHLRRLDLDGEDRFVAISHDSSERKEREQELERTMSLLTLAGELADVGGWSVDIWEKSPTNVAWTDKLYDIFEIPLEEDAPVEEVFEFYHPDDRERHRQAVDRAVERTQGWNQELRLITAKGNERWVHNIGEPVTEDGEIVEIHGIIQDITERKAREERLRRRRHMIESLYDATKRLLTAGSVEATSDRIVEVLGDVFDFALVNTGFVEDDVVVPMKTIPDPRFQVPLPEPQPLESESVSARALRAGETIVVGNVHDLDNAIDYGDLQSVAAVPMSDHGVVVIGQVDSDTFDAFELRLIEVLAGYATLVLDRLRHETELVEAKEEAEAASQLKSAMLANMSHEIRTPLTSISGFAEVLAGKLEGEEKSLAKTIWSGADRLMQTLESVFQLSRLEAGEFELKREPVRLETLIDETVEMLRPSATKKSLSVETDVEAPPVEGSWNKAALQRILENLLENAIKFTPEGGRVEVCGWEEDGQAVLEVEDTGVGISEEAQADVFEAFQQESKGFGREYEGTGLGLSIVKRLVDVHEGIIELESEKGQGSRFNVRLPLDGPRPASDGET